MIKRKITKKIMVGGVPLGGGSRISVQSMLNVPADQVEKSVEQALALEKAGCDIVRIAVPNREAVRLVYALKSVLSIPVVADIHFDYRLALEAAAAGRKGYFMPDQCCGMSVVCAVFGAFVFFVYRACRAGLHGRWRIPAVKGKSPFGSE